jgi:hypothetical protein
MIISIHQPNFVPWYPFFQKIEQADVFIILTHCQFEKNNFQNRFNYNGWNTMSTNSGLEPIINKRYLSPEKDWNKITSKHPKLKVFDDLIFSSLAQTNSEIIKRACKILKINTEIVTDYDTHLKSTERLVDLCRFYGGKEYISGMGGKKYLDESLFKKAGIKISYQEESIKKPLIDLL